MEPDQAHPLLKVFSEAQEWARGGEVVVRCGTETGRVFFVEGRIAWALASTIRRNFLTYIVEHTDLTKAQLQEVFDACKQSGQNFGETIIEWGLLSEDVLRELLLRHISGCLFEILCWSPVESMFVPDERSYSSNLTFQLDEVLESVIDLDTEGRLTSDTAAAEELPGGVPYDATPDTAPPETPPPAEESIVPTPLPGVVAAAGAVPAWHDRQEGVSRRDIVWWLMLNLAGSAALWLVVLWVLRR